MLEINFNVITNNVKGLRTSCTKRHGIFNRLKDLIKNKGIIMLQETHSDSDIENLWTEEFGKDNELFFSHGASNARGVCIGIVGNFGHTITNKIIDTDGRFIILEAKINNNKFIIVNIYNENRELQQIALWESLQSQLNSLNIDCDTEFVLAGDFNLFFNQDLEAKGGNPTFKKQSIARFISIKEHFDLVDIWRIKNPAKKRYTFGQQHYTGYLQRRLDYIFISNGLQNSVKNVDVGTRVMTDHSPVSLEIKSNNINSKKGPNLWKYNSSLNKNDEFVAKMRTLINEKIQEYSDSDEQIAWELLKYEIRKFAIDFSKNLAKEKRREQQILEQNLKRLEESDIILNIDPDYIRTKIELENLINEKTEGIRIRAKCTEYEENERSSKYFLNLEKRNGKLSALSAITNPNGGDDILEHKEIMTAIYDFYSDLFKNKCNSTPESCQHYLRDLPLKVLSNEQKNLCNGPLSIEELYEALLEMNENKSPGNDGLSPEFYKMFWNSIKLPLFASVNKAKACGQLSTSQRQAIIRLIEKKDKDKKFIKNWRPISLLNTDLKIISRTFAKRLKEVLPSIISSKQTAYVKDRFIGEGARLISDILEVTDILKIGGYMVTIDFEKAFDSLNHTFLIETLKKIQFPEYFIEWIHIFLRKQESCVINNGTTTKYFPLESGARQGDPISAYLFIIALEALFLSIEKNRDIKPIEILGNTFLYNAYADDATFFLQDSESIINLVNELKLFSKYSGLRPNYNKCETCAIGSLKGVTRALCGFKPIDLTNDSAKILGLHFSYNKKIQEDRNFIDTIKKMETILQIWRSRNLTLLGKIAVFKTLAISKLVYCSYLSNVPNSILETVNKIQNKFIWSDKPAKISHFTMCNAYERGGLQKTDINLKVDALHLSWVRRLFDDNDHQWKYIPKICLNIDSNESFFPNYLPRTYKKELPAFYKNIINKWANCSTQPNNIQCIYNQPLWNNKYIKINSHTLNMHSFRSCGINYIHQIINANNRFKSWSEVQAEFNLNTASHFQYIQLIDSVPVCFKDILYSCQYQDPEPNPGIGMWHKARFITIDKLISKEIYMILIRNRDHEPTAKKTFIENFPQLCNYNWQIIYMLPRRTTNDCFLRIFQYKILNNILFLNKKLHIFGMVSSPLCSFCNLYDETTHHIFSDCFHTLRLWEELKQFLMEYILIPPLNPQSALFGFHEESNYMKAMLLNHILLIFKLFIYRQRDTKILLLAPLLKSIKNIFNTEIDAEKLLRNNSKYSEKWDPIRPLFQSS